MTLEPHRQVEFRPGQKVKVTNCPGLDGEQVGVISAKMRGGYAVTVTGYYYCGTNCRRELKTETNFIATKDIQADA